MCGGNVFAAANANNDTQALNARWAAQAFAGTGRTEVSSQNRLFVVDDSDPAVSPVINQSVTNKPLRLAQKTHTHGIGANSMSRIRVELVGGAELMEKGLVVEIPDQPGAVIVKYSVAAAK